MIRRGEVRWFLFFLPDKRRPVHVVGRDDVLPALAQIPIIPLSTVARGLRWEVPLGPEDGLLSPCVLKPEWIRIVERAHLGPLVAHLPDRHWKKIRTALLDVLGLDE